MKLFSFMHRKVSPKKEIILSTLAVFLISSLVILSVVYNVTLGFQLASSKVAYYSGNPANGGVSVMVNVYEGAEVVEEMLEILKENNAKATFFIGGTWAVKNNETLLKIKESGNEIASHGFFHKDHKKLNLEQNKDEIRKTEKVIYEITGVKVNLFAPPSGSFNNVVLEAAGSLEYRTIMWTKDTIDWRDSDINTLVTRATKNVKAGDFILMHPKPHSSEVLRRILNIYNQQGLKCLTVSNNLL